METFEGGGPPLDTRAPNVIYQPRGSTHRDEDGTNFLFVGGAPSIDWQHRTEGRSIWTKEEVISDDEFMHALRVEGPIDVLVTHDAATFPPGYGPKGDPEFRAKAQRSMWMIHELIREHRPTLHVHGHWHVRRSTTWCDDDPVRVTRVEGLNCNHALFKDATMLWSASK
jgi:hypothetical protein